MKHFSKCFLLFLYVCLVVFPECRKYIVVVDSVNPPVIHTGEVAAINCTVLTGVFSATERVRTTVTSATASGCGSVTSGMGINQFDFTGGPVDRECTATVTVSLTFDSRVNDEATVVVLPPIVNSQFQSYTDSNTYISFLNIAPDALQGPNGWIWTYDLYFTNFSGYAYRNEILNIVMTLEKPAISVEVKSQYPASVPAQITTTDKKSWKIIPSTSGSGWGKLTIVVNADAYPGGTVDFTIGIKSHEGVNKTINLKPTGPK